MADNILPINYPVARFPTKKQALEAAKKWRYIQIVYIGWFAARYWGVPGRGWYVQLPKGVGPRRLASEEELTTGRVLRRSSDS